MTLARTFDVKVNGRRQKTTANSDHEIFMDSEHLANVNQSKSLFDVFYVDKSLYRICTSSTTQAFYGLKSKGRELASLPMAT